MNAAKFIFRSLRFHARSHLGALLGAAVGSAVLIGALVVGDSVRGSLREMALARLGNIELALASNDRLFRQALAAELESALPAEIAGALQLPGTAVAAETSARANHVQVIGVAEDFWDLANQTPGFGALSRDAVLLNEALAEHLRADTGDSVLLRIQKPSQLSRDAPLSPEEDSTVAWRVRVAGVVRDSELGRFSLQASQIPPLNAFVSLAWLQDRVECGEQANLLLVGSKTSQKDLGRAVKMEEATAALRKNFQIADAELRLRPLPDNGGVELRSARVFIDAPIAEVALRAAGESTGILTYLVNVLRIGERVTPYSMVAGMGLPIVPPEMRDDEILVNEWLAEDLNAKPGDQLELKYFVGQSMRKLDERSAAFRVRSILPLSGPAADPTLMPDFPGLTDAENCRDWDTGFAIQTDKIRPKDEKYWDEFKGTPKAFVTLAAAQKLWSNRFGNLTAVRYPPGTDPEEVSAALRNGLNPAVVGLNFQPVRELALASSMQAQDFGQLFLGFSLFLVVSALLLMALMFQFGVEQRTNEIGTLLALGFSARQVRRLLFIEASVLSLAGVFIGMIGGVYYAQAMLYGLSTIWRDAVGTSALRFHAEPVTFVGGGLASMIIVLGTIWLALRKQARQPAYELLAEGAGSEARAITLNTGKRPRAFWIGFGAGAAALILVLVLVLQRQTSPGGFFGAGALLLISGLGLFSWTLWRWAVAEGIGRPSLSSIGVRNSLRRRKRSLATVTLLACGSFLILAIGVFRLDEEADAEKRSSGTGGFALIGESSMRVYHDLNVAEGRDVFGLKEDVLREVRIVPFRVRDGEDASCLNLNRAQRPRLLGVRPELLHERGAFTFARVAPGHEKTDPWLLLNTRLNPGEIPAIGDQASIQWALGKKIGDTLDYTDEQGRPFKIRLVAAVANSILQGNLIISDEAFLQLFPQESGYRMFLVDAPSNRVEEVAAELSRGLRDAGLELVSAPRRLAAFNAVQNTYLGTFQVLGGLGLLLGSAGLGVVVVRNVLERRGELALLLAVGFRSRALKWLVLSEHGVLLLLGLGIGLAAAFVAVFPALLSARASVPFGSLALTLAAVLLSGAVWTWLATWLALRGRLLNALRNE